MSYGNVMILGDSYSTFAGYIPQGYEVYYSPTADFIDVNDVKDTWWHRLLAATGSHLVMNNSWSGSTICYTGYEGYVPAQSFVLRACQHIVDGAVCGEKIDTLFIFGATNDSWNNSPVGDVQYEGWTDHDLCACLPAFCKILDHVRTTAPDVRIINIINKEVKEEIANGMVEACAHYQAECILLTDLDLTGGHPTAKGMKQIAEQVLEGAPEKNE